MILVSGGTGLVGSHLLLKLVEQEEPIRALYRKSESISKCKKVFEAYQKLELFEKIEWKEADLNDYFALKEQFNQVKKVYHSAAVVSFDSKDAEAMMNVNIEGTSHLVNISLELGVEKFCYVSSIASLGSYADGRCTDEEAIWQKTANTSNYSISKYYAENEVWRASEEGLSVVIVNPTTIIGYGDWHQSSNTIFRKVAQGISYYPAGSNGFVGVKDVVDIMTTLMESDISGERYILVSENKSFKDLLTSIALSLNKKPPQLSVSKKVAKVFAILDQFRSKLLGQKPILTRESVQTAYRHKCFTSEKIKKELNFKFQSVDEAVKDASAHYLKESA